MRTPSQIYERAIKFRSRVRNFLISLTPLTPSDGYAKAWLLSNFIDRIDLMELVERETFGKSVSVQEPILLVTPGTGRTTGIVALFWAYIVATQPISVGVSAQDPYLNSFIKEYFTDDEVVLTPHLSSLNHDQFEELLREHRTIIVYGSDNTIDRYRNYSLPETRFVGYGSKFSIGLHIGTITSFDVMKYVTDITAYDGLGCLNTSVLYVESLSNDNLRRLEDLGRELKARYLHDEIAKYYQSQFHQSLFLTGNTDISEVIGRRTIDPSNNPLPMGYGTLYVVDLQGDVEGIREDLRGYRQYLSSATLLVRGDTYYPYQELLCDIGVQRVCHPGEAQNPSLSWSHDGQGNLSSFVNFLDLE